MARTKKELLPMDQLIAEYLRESIDESGVTYRDLAAQTGMSLNRIGIILRKEPPPATIGEVSRLAEVLQSSASDLIARAERALASRADYDIVANTTIDEGYGVPDSDFDNA